MTIADLCARAGVGRRTYADQLAGTYAARPATLALLAGALNRFRIGFGGEAGALAPHAVCKVCVVLAAFYLRDALKDVPDPAEGPPLFRPDPARALVEGMAGRDESDPGRRAHAQVRQLGMWIANGQLGFATADIGRAFGVTKQMVSKAVKQIEDDDGLDPVKRAIEEVFG